MIKIRRLGYIRLNHINPNYVKVSNLKTSKHIIENNNYGHLQKKYALVEQGCRKNLKR